MQLYFNDSLENIVSIETITHVSKVMRSKVGDKIEIVFEGNKHLCEIISISSTLIKLNAIEVIPTSSELSIEITLIQALTKNDKFDYIVQKSTELGVDSIIPWESKRTIVKYNKEKFNIRNIRWQKIAHEAARQSHRSKIPLIDNKITSLNEIISNFDYLFIAYEEVSKSETGADFQFMNIINKLQIQANQKVAIIVGPEGGIEANELPDYPEKIHKVSLGNRILRTETASLFMMSLLSASFN